MPDGLFFLTWAGGPAFQAAGIMTQGSGAGLSHDAASIEEQNARSATCHGGSTVRPLCGQFNLTVDAPPGSAGEILLPVSRWDAQVMVDGGLVWDGGATGAWPVEMTDQGILIRDLAGGEHDLTASFACHILYLPLVVRK